MKNLSLTILILFCSIALFAQSPREIKRDLYESIIPYVGNIEKHRVYDDIQMELRLDSVIWNEYAQTFKAYYSTIKRGKYRNKKSKIFVNKGVVFIFDGSEATVIKHRQYLDAWRDKILTTVIDLKRKTIKYDLI